MKDKYLVLQGNMNSCGDGQMNVIGWFENFEGAFKFMRLMHNDTRGYNRYPNGYLLTQIVDNEEDPLSDDYILSEMKFYY